MISDDSPPENNESDRDDSAWIQHEWNDSISPVTAVVEAVAATTGRDPTTLSPLNDYIDPDGLNNIVTSKVTGTENPVVVSFTYDDVMVRVTNNGLIEVQLGGTGQW